jgi:hypothetical protein
MNKSKIYFGGRGNQLNLCACGQKLTRGRLCNECLGAVPDFIREHFFSGSGPQRENATRWIRARASRTFQPQTAALAA